MGLFNTTKKIINVASTVYNLSDEYDSKDTYLRSLVVGTVLNGEDLTDNILRSISNGPYSNRRAGFRFTNNSNYKGNIISTIRNRNSVDQSILINYFPVIPDQTLVIERSFIESSDIEFIADKWLIDNNPSERVNDWVVEYTNDTTLTITYEDLTTQVITLSEPYNPDDDYLVVYYKYYNQDPNDSSILTTIASDNILLYKLGSGDVLLDTLLDNVIENDIFEFYPIFPLRLFNTSIRDIPEWYEDTKEAYRKSVGDSFEAVIDAIEENSAIGDIDHAYVHLGFSLNTPSKFELEYIYNFLLFLKSNQTTTEQDYLDWLTELNNPNSNSLFGFIGSQNPYTNVLNLKTENTNADNFDVKISWTHINERIFSGLGKANAKVGEYWWEYENNDVFDKYADVYGPTSGYPFNLAGNVVLNTFEIFLFHQVDENTHTVLKITNLSHTNFIYRGYNVFITGINSLKDTEESGFIIPLHEPTLKTITGLSRNEISQRGVNIVFNSVDIVKQKWYQRKVFIFLVQIAIIITTIVLSIIFANPAIGALGAKIASLIGVSIAATSTAALVIGAIANLLISTIVVKILELGLKQILPDDIASIISSIGGIIFSAGLSGGFDISGIIAELSTAPSIIKISIATLTELQTVINSEDISELQAEVASLSDEYDEITKIIEDNQYEYNIGLSSSLLDNIIKESFFIETPEQFFSRTLRTGSDIVNITMNYIPDFVENNLRLDLTPIK